MGYDWRKRVGKQIRPCALPKPFHDFASGRDVAAGSPAQRLAQRPGKNVNPLRDTAVFGRAPAGLPKYARAMAVVNHDHGIIGFGQVANRPQICNIAVHRKHAIGRDQAIAGALRFDQPGFQFSHIVVGVTVTLGLAKTHPVDN